MSNQRLGAGTHFVGFVLAVILTLASFYIVQHHVMSPKGLYITLTILAVVQLLVWLRCFLRLNTCNEDGKWDLISFLFSLVIVAVVVIGTLWIMYNLNYNMVH